MANLAPNPYSEFIREPNLLVPGKAPTGLVRLDHSNPLTDSIAGYFLFGQSGKALICQDLVSRQFGTFQPASTYSILPTTEGPAFFHDDTNEEGGYECPLVHFSGSENRMVVARVHSTVLADNNQLIYACGTPEGADGLKWFYKHSNGPMRIEIEGSGYTSSLNIVQDTWQTVGCALDGTTLGDHVLWVDKEEESATGSGTVNTTTTNLPIISGSIEPANDPTPFRGFIKWVAVFVGDRSMDYWRNLYFELEKDPYQILTTA